MKKQINIEAPQGRPFLHWAGKKALDKIEVYPAQEKEIFGEKNSKEFNKLFWGDNLQVLSHLLKEYRGKIDLIYIDPPFDSKADYVKKVKIKGDKVNGEQQSLLEEKQYSDIWGKDEFLQFIYERLQIMRELLSEKGSIYVHLDWHKGAHIKLMLDEIFGEENFLNEIVWQYFMGGKGKKEFAKKHDNIFLYCKNNGKHTFNQEKIKRYLDFKPSLKDSSKDAESGKDDIGYFSIVSTPDVWQIKGVFNMGGEYTPYPTQKPEKLLERIIKASTNEGDLVADFFCGSGTTLAVAQKLGRKWIGADINKGAISTTTKRINNILKEQKDEKDLKTPKAFKILNVNNYDIFKNELEAKNIILDLYSITKTKGYFDGILDNNFVKIVSPNRVLSKKDVEEIIKNIDKNISNFSVKKTSKKGEETYKEKVVVICSGSELDVNSFLKEKNNTGVKVEIRDIQTDKSDLVFKKEVEADIETKTKDKKIEVSVKEFFSPILIRKISEENEKVIDDEDKVKIFDFKQMIDAIYIDTDYNGKIFKADVIDTPKKNEVIKDILEFEYSKSGTYKVAVKIVDVLAEEYLEIFEIKIK